ncbi:MAG TPA: nuclear transport factor 2 family protein [Solirubrobacterales bacterium]|nr:nuclear transport factor 2 family protein [Solirubrobacterales bacterium]
MSEENVERVRGSFAAFNRGDFEAAIGAYHPEVEWIPYLGAVDRPVYRGHEELMGMWSEFKENLGLRLEVKEWIDADDTVITVVEFRGVGTSSGAEVHQTWAQMYSIRDGLIVRVEPFADKDAALEAAGLSE